MSPLDPARLATLAAQLDVAPRQLLVLAARIAQAPDTPLDNVRLRTELARVREAGEASETAAAIALLGYARFAPNHLDHALHMLWPEPHAGET